MAEEAIYKPSYFHKNGNKFVRTGGGYGHIYFKKLPDKGTHELKMRVIFGMMIFVGVSGVGFDEVSNDTKKYLGDFNQSWSYFTAYGF